MRADEFLPLDIRSVNVRQFDCGKSAINTYLRRYAAKNMGLNLNRTFVLPDPDTQTHSRHRIAAYYTLAHQTIAREDVPVHDRLPRYPVPVILLAQLAVDLNFHGRGLGAKTLVHALRHAYRISSSPNGIPSAGVALDVLDQDALKFYSHFDFFAPLIDKPMKLFVPMQSLETIQATRT